MKIVIDPKFVLMSKMKLRMTFRLITFKPFGADGD